MGDFRQFNLPAELLTKNLVQLLYNHIYLSQRMECLADLSFSLTFILLPCNVTMETQDLELHFLL